MATAERTYFCFFLPTNTKVWNWENQDFSYIWTTAAAQWFVAFLLVKWLKQLIISSKFLSIHFLSTDYLINPFKH